MECELDIVHAIDSRSYHRMLSSYADSQTITPGNKLSHDEIMRREKKSAQKALDKMLSKEASKLNYPLKM